ncbi:MAG: matrixin family metalloprotease [Nitrospirota bacterium]
MNNLFKCIALIFVINLWGYSGLSAFETCQTSKGLDIKWATFNATYYVNSKGGPAGSLSAIQSAMQTWTDVNTSSFIFLYGGSTFSTAHGINDGINIITFRPMGTTGILAANAFWYYVSSGQIIDSDIKFNTNYPWAVDGSANAYDVQNVDTHEHGHSLCLKDLYDSTDYEKTMYGYVSRGETKKIILDPDDINGISYLYPLPVQLIFPNGGEVVPSGSTYVIQWNAPLESVSFTLWYSLNNGTTWKHMASGVKGSSYNWDVPTPIYNKIKCFVKIIGYDISGIPLDEDDSDSKFIIEVVRLTSPNGGETLVSGNVHTITWQTNGTIRPVANIELYYTINSGSTWKLITTLEGNPKSYIWTIPSVTSRKNRCKVKVTLKDASGKIIGRDSSNKYFTIQPLQ